MGASSAGSVVLAPFPFSDLSESKLRPAVLLAEISRDDFVCRQVTSNPYADPNAVELAEEDFTEGSLRRVSYTRPGKLSTANPQLFEGVVGVLEDGPQEEIVNRIVQFLRAGRW
ncbi:MAG: MazF family transcriptional regulator [Bacteroidetes bacterium SW_9_63_38]|nr:MAG: MazF family transcriptional regulator [Bacteroidetes bacterium SW_9_63_38]